MMLARSWTVILAAMAVELSSLPVLVRRYVERVLPAASPIGKRVRIGQIGEMTLKPGARPRRFIATG